LFFPCFLWCGEKLLNILPIYTIYPSLGSYSLLTKLAVWTVPIIGASNILYYILHNSNPGISELTTRSLYEPLFWGIKGEYWWTGFCLVVLLISTIVGVLDKCMKHFKWEDTWRPMLVEFIRDIRGLIANFESFLIVIVAFLWGVMISGPPPVILQGDQAKAK